MESRRALNAAIEERILRDRLRTEHVLRCIVQGCYCPAALGGKCQFCGEIRQTSVSAGEQAYA